MHLDLYFNPRRSLWLYSLTDIARPSSPPLPRENMDRKHGLAVGCEVCNELEILLWTQVDIE